MFRILGSPRKKDASELSRASVNLTADRAFDTRILDPEQGSRSDSLSKNLTLLPSDDGTEYRERAIVSVRGVQVGSSRLTLISGPEQITSAERLLQTALLLSEAGVSFLRADVRVGSKFRRRGVNLQKARMVANAAERFGLRTVFPVQTPDEFALLEHFGDILELSPELSWNRRFLTEISYRPVTVLLSRRSFLPLEQWLEMADLVTCKGRARVILLESGSRASKGLSVDLQTIIDAQRRSSYPLIVNCFAAAQNWSYVEQFAAAMIGAGVDGVQLQVEGDVLQTQSGADRTLYGDYFLPLTKRLQALRATLNATELMKRQGGSNR